MSYMQMPAQNQVIYQVDPAAVQMIHNMENTIYDLGKQYTGKRVRIQTMDGRVYEGIVLGADHGMLYLGVEVPSSNRAFVPASAIMPLVLYNLLVISLL